MREPWFLWIVLRNNDVWWHILGQNHLILSFCTRLDFLFLFFWLFLWPIFKDMVQLHIAEFGQHFPCHSHVKVELEFACVVSDKVLGSLFSSITDLEMLIYGQSRGIIKHLWHCQYTHVIYYPHSNPLVNMRVG